MASIFRSILASIFAPFWLHLGIQLGAMLTPFFAQDGGTEFNGPFFFVGSMLFFDLRALMASSWHHLGSILEGSGLHFGGFCKDHSHMSDPANTSQPWKSYSSSTQFKIKAITDPPPSTTTRTNVPRGRRLQRQLLN